MNTDEALLKAAIANAIKRKEAQAAAAALPDGLSVVIDKLVHIFGTIQKGKGTPDSETKEKPDVNLATVPVLAEICRRYKITPASLKRTLLSIAKEDAVVLAAKNTEHQNTFAIAAAEHRETLKPQARTIKGRAGAVRVDLTITPQ